jgi:hypothetical protein
VAREWDGRVGDSVNTACPLQCWRRHGDAGDHSSKRSDVDWAGLPINLDMAFSQQQSDKVYMQHLLRRRGSQLLRGSKDLAQLCVCEVTAERGNLDSDAASLT